MPANTEYYRMSAFLNGRVYQSSFVRVLVEAYSLALENSLRKDLRISIPIKSERNSKERR